MDSAGTASAKIRVHGPDGKMHEFNPGTPVDQIDKAMSQRYAKQEPGALRRIWDAAGQGIPFSKATEPYMNKDTIPVAAGGQYGYLAPTQRSQEAQIMQADPGTIHGIAKTAEKLTAPRTLALGAALTPALGMGSLGLILRGFLGADMGISSYKGAKQAMSAPTGNERRAGLTESILDGLMALGLVKKDVGALGEVGKDVITGKSGMFKRIMGEGGSSLRPVPQPPAVAPKPQIELPMKRASSPVATATGQTVRAKAPVPEFVGPQEPWYRARDRQAEARRAEANLSPQFSSPLPKIADPANDILAPGYNMRNVNPQGGIPPNPPPPPMRPQSGIGQLRDLGGGLTPERAPYDRYIGSLKPVNPTGEPPNAVLDDFIGGHLRNVNPGGGLERIPWDEAPAPNPNVLPERTSPLPELPQSIPGHGTFHPKLAKEINQSVDARVREIYDLFTEGLGELSKKAKNIERRGDMSYESSAGMQTGFGSIRLKDASTVPELMSFRENPGRIADAIKRGKGDLYRAVREAVTKDTFDKYGDQIRQKQQDYNAGKTQDEDYGITDAEEGELSPMSSEQIEALKRLTGEEGFADISKEKSGSRGVKAAPLGGNRDSWILQSGGGYMEVTFSDDGAYIHQSSLPPDMRGKGFGSAMYEKVGQMMKERGIPGANIRSDVQGDKNLLNHLHQKAATIAGEGDPSLQRYDIDLSEAGFADASKDQKGFNFVPTDVPGQEKGQAATDLFDQIIKAKDSRISKREILGIDKKKKSGKATAAPLYDEKPRGLF
jgi:hypothetical protein